MRNLLLICVIVCCARADTLLVVGQSEMAYRYHRENGVAILVDSSVTDTAWTSPSVDFVQDAQIPFCSFQLPTGIEDCHGFTVEAHIQNLTDDSLAFPDTWALIQTYPLDSLPFNWTFNGYWLQWATTATCEYGAICSYSSPAGVHEYNAELLAEDHPSARYLYVGVQAIPRQQIRVVSMTLSWDFVVSPAREEVREQPQPIVKVYPNPFNSDATISLELPQSKQMDIELFNLLGQRVSVIHQGQLSAGQHSLTIDGSGLPTAVYFLRMGDIEVLKVNILK